MFFDEIISQIMNEFNLSIDTTGMNNFDIFEACVNAGVDQGEIINKFETALNIPFVNIMEIDPDYSLIKKYGMARFQELGVYPYSKNDVLHIAVSDSTQIDKLDAFFSENQEYIPEFCFDFLIAAKLQDVTDEMETVTETVSGREVVEINANRQSIMLATGQDNIDTLIEESPVFRMNFYVLEKLHKRELILEKCEELNPDILLVGDNIGGKAPLIQILLQTKITNPNLRIIFLAGKVNPGDDVLQANLGLLASVGIYDILTDAEISISKLQHVFEHPQDEKDVEQFMARIKDSAGKKNTAEIVITVPDEIETEDTVRLYSNLYTFVSPSGGVGKSTIVQNLAVALDKHAMPKLNGKKPKIAVIDLDFQGFSTSRFFDTLNKDNHIFSAIDAAKKAIDELGTMRELSKLEEAEISETIHSAFVQSKKYKNVYVLGGDDKVYRKGQLNSLNSYLLTFIIELIVTDFDIILIDSYTRMEATTIYPLYHMSHYLYNILNVSFNAFNVNKRYLTFLEEREIYQSENNKFILNAMFDLSESYLSIKDIQNALGMDFDYIFPKVPDQLAFNMNCKGESFFESQEPEVGGFQAEILDLANDIMPLKNFDTLMTKTEAQSSKKFKKDKKEKDDKEKTQKSDKKSLFSTLLKKKDKATPPPKSEDEESD